MKPSRRYRVCNRAARSPRPRRDTARPSRARLQPADPPPDAVRTLEGHVADAELRARVHGHRNRGQRLLEHRHANAHRCLRISQRVQHGENRALVFRRAGERLYGLCPVARSSTVLPQLVVDTVEAHSMRWARGVGVTSMTTCGSASSPSTFTLERRLIGGLQGELTPDDALRFLNQESFEHRLRPGGLNFLEHAAGSETPMTRMRVSGPASIVYVNSTPASVSARFVAMRAAQCC